MSLDLELQGVVAPAVGSWKANLDLQAKQQVFLSAEPSLKSPVLENN